LRAGQPAQALRLDLVARGAAGPGREEPASQRALDRDDAPLPHPPRDPAGAPAPAGDVDGVDTSSPLAGVRARDDEPEGRQQVPARQLPLLDLPAHPADEADGVVPHLVTGHRVLLSAPSMGRPRDTAGPRDGHRWTSTATGALGSARRCSTARSPVRPSPAPLVEPAAGCRLLGASVP